MRFGNYNFTPSLWPSLATLVLIPVLVGLGIWQLERASWKQALVDSHLERTRLPAIDFASLDGFDKTLQYRQVRVRGVYDAGHQLLLDNRTIQGHAGYHVLTPLRLTATGKRVLVNRGWVPLGLRRDVLPEIPAPAGEVTLMATLMLPPEKLFRLGTVDEAGSGWPRVVQQVEMTDLQQKLDMTLLPVILLLDKDDEHGFIRDWKAVYGISPDKHRAYAVQWFTLAAVLLMIYIGVNTKRVPREE